MISNIERAAVSARPEDIRAKLRNAPSWVRSAAGVGGVNAPPAERPAWHYGPENLAAAPGATAKPSRPQTRSLPAVIGWLAGVCCPGVSRPAYAVHDGERLPEQFTGRALEMILAQARSGAAIPLTWNHDGPVIASSDHLDLMFSVERLTGLEFDARLRDTKLAREVLAQIEGRSLGVSIGFDKTVSWVVERDGFGRVRIVDECRLHHVAVLPRTATLRPAYSGARCYGTKGATVGCPGELRTSARAWAFRFIREQAGVRS